MYVYGCFCFVFFLFLGRFTSLLLPLVFGCFGVCFETKVNSVGRSGRYDVQENKEGKGGREWREGRKRNSISQHQTIIL